MRRFAEFVLRWIGIPPIVGDVVLSVIMTRNALMADVPVLAVWLIVTEIFLTVVKL